MRLLPTLLLLLLSGLAPAAAQQWVEHRPPGAGYRVEFPAAPKVSKETIDTPTGKTIITIAEYETSSGGTLVAFQNVYQSGPSSPSEEQAALDLARDGGIKSANAKLLEEKKLTVSGKPARRIVIEMPDKLMGVALLVLDGNRLYNTMAVVARGDVNSANVERFLNSFALVAR